MADDDPRPLVVRLLPALDFGGVESRAVLQSELFARGSYRLRVCTFAHAGAAAERIRRAGVPVDILGVNPAVRSPVSTLVLARYLARVKPQVLHSSIAEANFHGALAGRTLRVPKVIVEEVGIPQHQMVGRLAFRLVYRLADAALGVSTATCEAMLKQDGAPPDRVRLVRNCANLDFFPTERVSALRTPDGCLKMLAVGRLVEVKNQETLIRALGGLKRRGIRARLTLLGEGPLRGRLQQSARDEGVSEAVTFCGFSSDVRSHLANHDCFVLPSFSEGCSISLIEAMAAALPPMTSRAAGNLEVMGELADAWCVPSGDRDGWEAALSRFSRLSAPERQELGRRAQQIAYDRFSPSVYLGVLERLYLEN